ncbi:uncharacterized protein [Drosophila virilis]|uniref:Uncharacterized protein n=1 Tax=Drosophila virilis TaxID=7244 RepID=B4LGN3_DROVI|nr:uncharacterized protein LOC6622447 [Drosophila virilis]EDW69471.2 uncharacterized protein Dvir_GJ13260 [Drosophila virilis]
MEGMWKIGLFLLHCHLLVAPLAASCPIFLTISLAGKTLTEACLEVNWGPDCFAPPEWVGIYRQDPSVSNFQPELRIDGIRNRTGKRLTPIKLGKLHFPGGWNRPGDEQKTATRYPKGKCLPYYVASYNGTELLTIDCLKIQPNWLAHLKDAASMPLKRLFLPGTHASGAYITNYSKTKSLLVKDYLVAQHFDVWSQLVFGIRYLDLSVGYRNVDSSSEADNFWVVNENMFINPLIDVIRDVRRFVQLSNEVVVLDFSSFPIGFYKHPEIYSSLYHLIRQELGEVVYERNVSINEHCADRSFDDMRNGGRQVLLLFPTQELPHPENESVLLCTPWQRFSTSYMNISQTLDYMRLLFSRKPESPVQDDGWIFHAVKSIEQALNTHKLQTAKERAALINPKVNQWLNGPWGLNANVVAMDYFSNTNLVDVAIQVNTHKAFLAANDRFVNMEILTPRGGNKYSSQIYI